MTAAVLLLPEGGGVGAAACVMVAPPSHLSDDWIVVLPSHNVPIGGGNIEPPSRLNRFLMGKEFVANILG